MIYEATITYVAIDEKGNDKVHKEMYLVDGKNLFLEVENELYKELYDVVTNLDVTAIKRSRIKEIANYPQTSDEKIFLATLVDVFLNDDGSEKEMKYTIAFFAKDITAAHAFITQYITQGYNMNVVAIKETNFDLL